MTFDPIRMLETLNRHSVKYILIGGMAATALGSPSVTLDLDVCYERSDENLEHLAAALTELGARLRGAPEGLPFRPDPATLKAGDHFTFTTTAGPLDCLGTPSGTNGYSELITAAAPTDLAGLQVVVVSLDDLIRMKRAAGRAKDRVELEVLGALRDEIEGDL